MTTTPAEVTASPVTVPGRSLAIAFRALLANDFDVRVMADRVLFRRLMLDQLGAVSTARLQDVARALGIESPQVARERLVHQVTQRLVDDARRECADELPAGTATAQANGRTYTLTVEGPDRVLVLNSRDEQAGWVDRLPSGLVRLAGAPKSWTGADYQAIQTAAAALLAAGS